MNTKAQESITFFFLLILSVLMAYGYYMLSFEKLDNGLSEQVSLFRDNYDSDLPHYTKMPISYSFSTTSYNCSSQRIEDVRTAFRIIEEKTENRVQFIESSEGKINIECQNRSKSAPDYSVNGINISINPANSKPNSYVLAETVTSIYEKSKIIDYAQITFFNDPNSKYLIYKCSKYPITEIHEIIHALGISEHSDNEESILYPETTQKQCREDMIDEEIKNRFKEIYG